MAEVLVLGGQMFQPAEVTTFAQDAAFMALVYETGVHRAVEEGGDLVGVVLGSGRVADFLACSLVPMNGQWTLAGAKEAAVLFGSLTDPDEKKQLMDAMAGVLTGFFAGASHSPTPIPTSSAAPAAPRGTPSPRQRRAKAASGTTSSPDSPPISGSPPPM